MIFKVQKNFRDNFIQLNASFLIAREFALKCLFFFLVKIDDTYHHKTHNHNQNSINDLNQQCKHDKTYFFLTQRALVKSLNIVA